MKILHIGTFSYGRSSLVLAQKRLGLSVDCMLIPTKDIYLDTNSELETYTISDYDILHIHNKDGLLFLNTLFPNGPKSIKQENQRIIYHDWEDSAQKPSPLFYDFLPYLDMIMWSNPSAESLYSDIAKSCFVPEPVLFEEFVLDESNRQEPPHIASILYIPELNPLLPIDSIKKTIDELNQKSIRYKLTVSSLSNLSSASLLGEEFNNNHILIEHLNGKNYSTFGILGMAYGLTVLSGNNFSSHPRWDNYKLNTLLHTTEENLKERLFAISREPRCLRDFAKRGRRYAKLQHCADKIARYIITQYSNENSNIALKEKSQASHQTQ